MTDVLLQVTELRKMFGAHAAVDDVSFDVPEGGSLAIVGESGSGKTTIARMIVGLERPTSGTISFAGHDRSTPAGSGEERRRRAHEVQLVFQDPYTSLDPRQTIEASLDEALRLYAGGTSASRRPRLEELAALVGLDDRQLRARPNALSRSERVSHGLESENRLAGLLDPPRDNELGDLAELIDLQRQPEALDDIVRERYVIDRPIIEIGA